jgi:hypothetical protein
MNKEALPHEKPPFKGFLFGLGFGIQFAPSFFGKGLLSFPPSGFLHRLGLFPSGNAPKGQGKPSRKKPKGQGPMQGAFGFPFLLLGFKRLLGACMAPLPPLPREEGRKGKGLDSILKEAFKGA